MPDSDLIYCGCGCGQQCSKFTSRGKRRTFIKNHDKRLLFTGTKQSEATKQKRRESYSGAKTHWFGKKRDFETRKKISDKLKQNGTIVQGYRRVFKLYEDKNHKQVPEHRLIYEDFYKCCLLPWIDIHHINGVKTDNRIENLKPLDHKKHAVLHHNEF